MFSGKQRLALYSLIEGFDADNMDPREYLRRRFGITDPAMQDVWLQHNAGEATPRVSQAAQSHHSTLISVSKKICSDALQHKIVGIFLLIANEFMPSFESWLLHSKVEFIPKLRIAITDVSRAAARLANTADEAVRRWTTERPSVPVVPDWSMHDEPKHTNSQGIPTRFTNLRLVSNDRCYALVKAVEDQRPAPVAIVRALSALVEAMQESRVVASDRELEADLESLGNYLYLLEQYVPKQPV